MTLTRATLGKLTKRATKDLAIDGMEVRIQRPTPLEYSHYQMSLINKEGKAEIPKFAEAILLLVARMWIDDEGQRLFKDTELKELGSIDLTFYQSLSIECQKFAQPEASRTLGEFDKTTDSDSPVESASN